MKRVFVTQRVDIHQRYRERRDALDQRWVKFLAATAALPLPIPNDRGCAEELLRSIPPEGIVLTGGNSPCDYDGDAPERDEVDALLIQYAVDHGTPLVGVCHGLQSIVQFFGGTLKPVAEHAATTHFVGGEAARTVNSYHSLAVGSLPSPLRALAHSDDGSIEMLDHVYLPILGLMWHPERESEYALADITLFQQRWARGREKA